MDVGQRGHDRIGVEGVGGVRGADRERRAAGRPRREQPGRRVLHHDRETDFYVLAHVQEGNKVGKPHSHGTSWAVYGNARAFTEMTEWRRTNPESEPHAVLQAASKYRLGPGDTKAYGPGVIHSTAHPEKAWVIRVTGTDLDHLPRFRFDPRKDKIVEKV